MFYKKLLIVLIALIVIYFVFHFVPESGVSEKLETGLNEPELPPTGGIIMDSEVLTWFPSNSVVGAG